MNETTEQTSPPANYIPPPPPELPAYKCEVCGRDPSVPDTMLFLVSTPGQFPNKFRCQHCIPQPS